MGFLLNGHFLCRLICAKTDCVVEIDAINEALVLLCYRLLIWIMIQMNCSVSLNRVCALQLMLLVSFEIATTDCILAIDNNTLAFLLPIN